MSYVRCVCGAVYNTVGTTTGMSGCCPKCGLHHSGQYRVVKPVLKPSPLAAKPIDAPERTCRNVNEGHGFTCSECGDYTSNPFPEVMPLLKLNYCPNCGARVVE